MWRRCAEAGWTLEVHAAAVGPLRWFSGTDASPRAQVERAWADRATDAELSVAGGLGQRPGGWRGDSLLGRLNDLTQWRNAGLLQQVAGIGMGRFN